MGGFFAVIDGPSGVGKTSVVALAKELLARDGHKVVATAEPSRTPIGEFTRSSTHSLGPLALACLVAADRYHHLHTVIRPALAAGSMVICDRYLPTSLVLQAMDGVPADLIWRINQYIDRPNLTIILTGDPMTSRERARSRGTYSRFHDGGVDAGMEELERYQQISTVLPANGMPVKTIDVERRGIDEVAALVADELHSAASSPAGG